MSETPVERVLAAALADAGVPDSDLVRSAGDNTGHDGGAPVSGHGGDA